MKTKDRPERDKMDTQTTVTPAGFRNLCEQKEKEPRCRQVSPSPITVTAMDLSIQRCIFVTITLQ